MLQIDGITRFLDELICGKVLKLMKSSKVTHDNFIRNRSLQEGQESLFFLYDGTANPKKRF